MFEELIQGEVSLLNPVFWYGFYFAAMLLRLKWVKKITNKWQPDDWGDAYIFMPLGALFLFLVSPITKGIELFGRFFGISKYD